jgi:hypothetical protein
LLRKLKAIPGLVVTYMCIKSVWLPQGYGLVSVPKPAGGKVLTHNDIIKLGITTIIKPVIVNKILSLRFNFIIFFNDLSIIYNNIING